MNHLLRLSVVGGLIASAVLILAVGLARHDADLLAPVHLILFVLGIAAYLLPTMLALYRNSKATVWIAVLNVFLGWTLFGWFIAIGWAAGGEVRALPFTVPTPPKQALQGH